MQSIGHDLRRGLNNINPLGNNYKAMNKWLAEMKNIDSSLKTLDKEISAEAKLTAAWGANEGDDLTDVCLRMSQLMEEVGLIQQAYSLRHTAYRKSIKSIKVQEMMLDENRKKKHDLTGQITKLQKSSKENPIKMMELQSQLERVSAELLEQELELMQFKRVTVKEAFDAKFDAMLEFSEKMALIAGYGRAITFVIDTESQVADRMRIYNGGEYTAAAVNQVKSAVTNWQAQPVDEPPRAHVAPSQDELALSAAAAAYNSKTPPTTHAVYAASVAASDGHPNGQQDDTAAHGSDTHQTGFQEHAATDQGYVSPPASTHQKQLNHIQEQQRQLELEQQRLYQQNLASYSPEPERSPSQQHYQNAAGGGGVIGGMGPGGYTPAMPQEMYPPTPVHDNGYQHSPQHQQYGQYDAATYQSGAGASARNYRLGFVDPRERSQMEQADRYKAEVYGAAKPALPPLHFSQSPILHEK
ncbi:hypothetical protein BGZ67_006565 [Mortierella alpina]|nr:hypothetical protein BGZ67_006565 [Mortierella alpina]